MDYPSKECLFGLDVTNDKVKAQLGYVHMMLTQLTQVDIPAQDMLELYLLKTFRETSAFVHEASTEKEELNALHNYFQARAEYIADFLEITNASILQTNREA